MLWSREQFVISRCERETLGQQPPPEMSLKIVDGPAGWHGTPFCGSASDTPVTLLGPDDHHVDD